MSGTAGTAAHTAFIVDDDAGVRDSLGRLLSLHGYRTLLFASAEDFLAAYREDWTGILLLDVRMPGMSGLALQERLQDSADRMPVVVISAHGETDVVRAAFKGRAVDFLEKPFRNPDLLAALAAAAERIDAHAGEVAERSAARQRVARLSRRELQVFERVVAGQHNRDIAEALSLSPRTVEVYRARLMEKLESESLSDLIKLSMAASR
jgi:FixJ family two-component response regulator